MHVKSLALRPRPALALLVAICALFAAGSLSTGQAEAAVTCVGVPTTIARGGGNDTIYGTAGSDVIVAGAGNDTIYGFGGNDVICGDTGNDRVYGAEGNDYLRGGDGNDVLYGSFGADTLLGVNGGDSLAGGWGNDVLGGGPGNDVLTGGLNNDAIDGGGGQDTAYYPDSPVIANLSNYYIFTGLPRSVTEVSQHISGAVVGTDPISGVENVWGSPYGDWIIGDGANNTLVGGGGDDYLSTYDGGIDHLYGGDGNDRVIGIGLLDGGDGDDTLWGVEYLYGGPGNDVLWAWGISLLDCGPGSDRFASSDGSVVVSCEQGS